MLEHNEDFSIFTLENVTCNHGERIQPGAIEERKLKCAKSQNQDAERDGELINRIVPTRCEMRGLHNSILEPTQLW